MKSLEFYEQHREEYMKIEQRLDKLNEKFLAASRQKQRRLLLDSYIFAVISVQTPVETHENAFEQIKQGEEYEDALSSVNYWKNKVDYIRQTEVKFETIDQVIRQLEKGNTDAAHRMIADNFKGVATVKAAFTLAMLGFKTKACVDTNVLTALDIDRDEMYDGVVIKKYNEFVDESFKKISPDLLQQTGNKFMTQWVIFDSVRGELTTHDAFFNNLGVEI